MTATDELRLMLDERGVEWDADDEIMDDGSISQVTYWYSNDIEWSADGRDEYLAFDAVQLITPEQAIDATLGGGYQGFWTHDGTLHIELPKLPESILVLLPDKRDREIRSAKVWRYTQEPETCHDKCSRFNAWVCSECDATVLLMFDDYGEPSYSVDGVADVPKYCPNCGRRVVE